MAKKAKVETEAETAKAAAPVKHAYGVPELAEHMGLEPTSVRVKLRNADIPKDGRSYGWKTKKEMEQCAKDLAAASKPAKAETADEAPKTKKTRGKKAAAE